MPGPLVESAYAKLNAYVHGDQEHRDAVGPWENLSRPWDPPSCGAAVRQQVWEWLEQVADWVNHEYAWSTDTMIPACWPAHPHIAHELAVLADLRRRAGLSDTADAMEAWHRDTLPLFQHRMTGRLKSSCLSEHQTWPSASRYTAFTAAQAVQRRRQAYSADSLDPALDPGVSGARLHLPPNTRGLHVDLDTGEVIDDNDPDDGDGPAPWRRR